MLLKPWLGKKIKMLVWLTNSHSLIWCLFIRLNLVARLSKHLHQLCFNCVLRICMVSDSWPSQWHLVRYCFLCPFLWTSVFYLVKFICINKVETFDLFHNLNLVDAHEFDKRISETNSKDLLSQFVGSMFVLFIYQYLIVLIP